MNVQRRMSVNIFSASDRGGRRISHGNSAYPVGAVTAAPAGIIQGRWRRKWIERRSDGAGEPVEADVGEHLLAREDAFDVAAAVGPRAKFLDDPRREPHRRIGQPEA